MRGVRSFSEGGKEDVKFAVRIFLWERCEHSSAISFGTIPNPDTLTRIDSSDAIRPDSFELGQNFS
jgi:hypothetical protein